MMVLIIIPVFVERATHIIIPGPIEIIYTIFCSLSLVLGEMGQLYSRILWWDSMLHTLSGVLMGVLGYILINTIDKSEKNKIEVTPFWSSVLVLLFVMSTGYVWELFEWFSDEFFNTNMQSFINDTTGELLVGHAAITDTIKDMLLNLIGGVVIAFYGYFQLKHDKKGITKLALEKETRIEKNEVKTE